MDRQPRRWIVANARAQVCRQRELNRLLAAAAVAANASSSVVTAVAAFAMPPGGDDAPVLWLPARAEGGEASPETPTPSAKKAKPLVKKATPRR